MNNFDVALHTVSVQVARMTRRINSKYKLKNKVSCKTCHNGAEKPD